MKVLVKQTGFGKSFTYLSFPRKQIRLQYKDHLQYLLHTPPNHETRPSGPHLPSSTLAIPLSSASITAHSAHAIWSSPDLAFLSPFCLTF